jgi:maleamate amidohydrolase
MDDAPHPWDAFLTERDRRVMHVAGYGARQGFGRRPALLVVDVTYGFTGDRPEPIEQSIARWSNSSGLQAWDAIAAIEALLLACRERGIPVIYTRNEFRADGFDMGSWRWKTSRSAEMSMPPVDHPDPNAIVVEIAPGPRDIVVRKQKPSGFFGTGLASYLTLLGCDSLLVVGGTTSGCVRATVTDAFSLNYRVAVVADGCFDRCEASQAMSLFDMHAKYADVVRVEEALAFVGRQPAGMFDLPGAAV